MLTSRDFIFGCGSVGSRISKSLFFKLFDYALKININKFDSTFYYGKGLSEKYLFQASKHYNKKITSTIKFGEYPKIDLLTIAVHFFRFEFSNLLKINKCPKISDFSTNDLKEYVKKYLKIQSELIKFESFFFHGVKQPIKKKINEDFVNFLKKNSIKFGYTEPFKDDLDYIINSNLFDIIHIDTEFFLKNKNFILKNFTGEIWLNRIIKFTRLNRLDWLTFCKDIKLNYQNTKFVIGFNKIEMLNEIQNNI